MEYWKRQADLHEMNNLRLRLQKKTHVILNILHIDLHHTIMSVYTMLQWMPKWWN